MIISAFGIFCIIAILTILFLGQKEFRQYIQNVTVAFRLPGPPAYPIIGNSYLLFNGLFKYCSHAIGKYGRIQRAWGSVFPFFLIFDPKHIEKILQSSDHLEKNACYRLLGNLLGNGLVVIGGMKWENHRKLIQPSFRTSTLASYTPVMANGAFSFLEGIKQTIQTNGSNELNITRLVNASIAEILTGIVLGISKDELPDTAYGSRSLDTLSLGFMKSFIFPWLDNKFFKYLSGSGRNASKHMDDTRKWMAKVVVERRDNQKTSPSEDSCILDDLLRLNFNEEECIDEIHSFMLVGHDTVAGATALTLHLIAKHQNVQAIAHAEVESVLGGQMGPIYAKDINDLQYIEQCIKETLRLFPNVSIFGRTLSKEIDLDGLKLPAGAQVIMLPYVTHRLSEYFPNPEAYDPDRFNLRNSLNRPSCAYLPFSQGSRNCIGNKLALMQIKVLVATTLQKYHLSLPEGKENLVFKFRVSLRASGGVWIKFTQREQMEENCENTTSAAK